MQQNDQQTQDLLKREQAEYDPVMRQTSALLARKAPDQPKLEKQPDAPKQNLSEGAAEWMQAATVISAIAGAFTRRSATNALTAFAGAVNGFKQGKLDVYEQNYKTWQAESKKISENNSLVMQQYQATLNERKMDIDQKMAQIQLISARYHDPIMAQAAAAKNYTAVAQILERADANQKKMDQAYATMVSKHDEFVEKLAQEVKTKSPPIGSEQWFAWYSSMDPAARAKYDAVLKMIHPGTNLGDILAAGAKPAAPAAAPAADSTLPSFDILGGGQPE